MSLKSMTGYGRGQSRRDGLHVEVEISSVNRKQLDVQANLPRSLQVLESRIQNAVSHALSRGRVNLNVYFKASPGAVRRVRVDLPLARAYIEALRDTGRKLGLRDQPPAEVLLQLPEALIPEQPQDDVDRAWPALEEALGRALQALTRMRSAEGRALQADLVRRIDNLERMAGNIGRQAPAAAVRYQDQLHRKIREAGLSGGDHTDRITREIIVFAERCDIAEELTRIDSHLRQTRKLIKSREAVGRPLDFIAQELFREINTVGSKSSDAAIGAEVVAFKAELERVREQVQNVE